MTFHAKRRFSSKAAISEPIRGPLFTRLTLPQQQRHLVWIRPAVASNSG